MRIKQFFTEKLSSIHRFFVPFLWTVYIAVCTIILIVSTNFSNEHAITFILIGIFGFFLSILFKLIEEYLDGTYDFAWAHYLPALSILSFALYPWIRNFQSAFSLLALFGIVYAIISLIAFFSFKRELSKSITQFIKTYFLTCIITLILCGGISLCLYAVYSLIWAFPSAEKVFLITNMLIITLVAGNLILSGLTPPSKTLARMGKIYKGILYVAFAVYAILLAVLIVYFAKIIITWNLPSNRVSLFGNFAVYASVFFVFVMDQFRNDDKVVKIHQKIIGIIMLVIIAMNFASMGVRVSQYGLTESRYLALVLNGGAALFAISCLIKRGKFNNYVFVAIALVTILLTSTPLNFIRIPFENQKSMLITELKADNMYDNGAIIPNSDINDRSKEYIIERWNAISNSPQMDKDAWKTYKNMAFSDVFGFEQFDYINYNEDYVVYNRSDNPIDIAGYSSLQTYNNSNDKTTVFYSFLYNIYLEYGTNTPPDSSLELPLDNGDKIILRYVSFTIDETKGEVTDYSVSGYYLTK